MCSPLRTYSRDAIWSSAWKVRSTNATKRSLDRTAIDFTILGLDIAADVATPRTMYHKDQSQGFMAKLLRLRVKAAECMDDLLPAALVHDQETRQP